MCIAGIAGYCRHRQSPALTVNAATVHQHAVQPVQVAHFAVRVGSQVGVSVQVQLLGELIAVGDLGASKEEGEVA